MSIDFYASPEKFQEQIAKLYKEYKIPVIKINNQCSLKNSEKFQLSQSQKFVTKYFTLNNPDGLLLYHSVGAGKTLASLSILRSFENQGFNAIFVTRTTLKGDIDKAVDMLPLKNKLLRFSYKQFSNICKRRGKNYELLMEKTKKINTNEMTRTNDPFYKTIIVIDEAHKLYTKDLKPQEMHDIKLIQKTIYESYNFSKENRCRIVLLTATPVSYDPFEILKLFNLIIVNPTERIDLVNFQNDFLDNNAKFTEKGEKEFKYLTKGLVSYLDASKNPNTFAKISLTEIYVPISEKPDLKISVKDCTESQKECLNMIPKIPIAKLACTKYFNECKNKIIDNRKYLKTNKFQIDQVKSKCNIKIK
jgi:hypothetical protein